MLVKSSYWINTSRLLSRWY